MNTFAAFDDLETPLVEEPLFPAEAPDGKKHIAETPRQRTFINKLRNVAPGLIVWANANAGKRHPTKARQEGIVSGVFDVTVTNGEGLPRFTAYPEFKGYTAAGRAGELSANQISWGNRMHRAGHHVACFFDPDSAVEWIRSICPSAFIDRRNRL